MKTPIDRDVAKVEAKKLFVQDFLTAKEIAGHVGISEKSIGVWAAKYKWKEQRSINAELKHGIKSVHRDFRTEIITELKQHMQKLNPELFKKCEPLIDNFLQIKKNQPIL